MNMVLVKTYCIYINIITFLKTTNYFYYGIFYIFFKYSFPIFYCYLNMIITL